VNTAPTTNNSVVSNQVPQSAQKTPVMNAGSTPNVKSKPKKTSKFNYDTPLLVPSEKEGDLYIGMPLEGDDVPVAAKKSSTQNMEAATKNKPPSLTAEEDIGWDTGVKVPVVEKTVTKAPESAPNTNTMVASEESPLKVYNVSEPSVIVEESPISKETTPNADTSMAEVAVEPKLNVAEKNAVPITEPAAKNQTPKSIKKENRVMDVVIKEEIAEKSPAPKKKKNDKFSYEGGTDVLVPDVFYDSKVATPAKGEITKLAEPTPTPPASEETDVYVGMPFDMTDLPREVVDQKDLDPLKYKKLIREERSVPNFEPGFIPEYTDDELKERLAEIPSAVPLVATDKVLQFIRMYVQEKREQVNRFLGRTDLYFPLIEKTLDKHQVPFELKALAVIESALKPDALSSKGKSGLWQLEYNVAQRYGLDMNSFIDERRDPYLSTDAAARYLKDLHKQYNENWHIALAAYNAGETEIVKAINRSRGSRDFWKIKPNLPIENQDYVELFIAANYVLHYYLEHNFQRFEVPYDYHGTDTVMIKRQTDIRDLASQMGMPVDELKFLNPALKEYTIPRSKSGYPLTIPVARLKFFEIYRNNLKYLPKDGANSKEFKPVEQEQPKLGEEKRTTLNHTVIKGENILIIAGKYDCELADIKRWNGMVKNDLKEGQVLKIFVPLKDYDKYVNP